MHAGWRYDPSFQISDYTFSNLDLTTMTNISSGDQRLWVHLLSCWVISLFVWRVCLQALLGNILCMSITTAGIMQGEPTAAAQAQPGLTTWQWQVGVSFSAHCSPPCMT
jgi:hypothetical protein